MPEKKNYVSVSKVVYKKNLAIFKSLCTLQELYTVFKKKKSNLNIGISKFCALRAKSCVMAGSKMIHSVCVCSTHQHVRVLVDAMNWDLIYKNLIKKIVYNPDSNKCIMHQCKSCSGTATLEEFLYQELNEHEDD